MGFQDRDYWADKHREIEQGASKPTARSPVRATGGVQQNKTAPARPDLSRRAAPMQARSAPPDLADVFKRWWFQLLLWIAAGLVLFELFRHLPKH